MGLYIRPVEISKEEWLKENAIKVPVPEVKDFSTDPYFLVRINAGPFSALAVCYSEHEFNFMLEVYNNIYDLRPMQWYTAPAEAIRKVPGCEKL